MTAKTSLFSDSYAEARQAFLEACDLAGGAVESHQNLKASGPKGEPLFADAAWFGPADADTVFLNTSGVHGAEGFAGSAVQRAWLLDGGAKALPPKVAVLMVHAVNPFGFAHCLRATENNVDLNRNWIDFAQPFPSNPLYALIHPHLCLKGLDAADFRDLATAGQEFAGEHGEWALEDAISRGQYEFADGLHYGGRAPEWSSRTLMDIAQRKLKDVRRVVFIDWHTGPVGDGELIYLPFNERGSSPFERLEAWWGADNLDQRTIERLWGGKRPSRHGLMSQGIERLLAPGAEMAGAVIEFCSAEHNDDPHGMLRISLIERWLRFETKASSGDTAEYLEEMRHNYAPRRESWQEEVVANALGVYERTLKGTGNWAND